MKSYIKITCWCVALIISSVLTPLSSLAQIPENGRENITFNGYQFPKPSNALYGTIEYSSNTFTVLWFDADGNFISSETVSYSPGDPDDPFLTWYNNCG